MAIRTPFHSDHQIFLLVADKRNISKAAEALGVGQSGLSKAIRRLEQEAGAPLLARRNVGVELTREGQALLRALKDSHAAWASSYASKPAAVEGRFRLGGHSSVLSVYLPGPFSRLLKTYPGVAIEVVTGTSLETTRQVAALKLDFGIVVNHVRATDVIARKLSVDFIARWKLGNTEPQWICYNPEMLDIGKTLRRLERRRLVPIPDYNLIYEMIMQGECEGILPNSMIRNSKVQMTGKPVREVQVSLIYHSNNARLPAFQAITSLFCV